MDLAILKKTLREADRLAKKHPANIARIDQTLLAGLGFSKTPGSLEEKRRNIEIVNDLFAAGWFDAKIVRALRHSAIEKKYLVELLMVANGLYFLHDSFLLCYQIGFTEDKPGTKLPDKTRKKALRRICKALSRVWTDDELVANIWKFDTFDIIVSILSIIGWGDMRIVKAFGDTKIGPDQTFRALQAAGWKDSRIIRALESAKWSDYNIASHLYRQLFGPAKWTAGRIVVSLLANNWNVDRICDALLSIKQTSKWILSAFMAAVGEDKETLLKAMSSLRGQGILSRKEAKEILASNGLDNQTILRLVNQSGEGLIPRADIEKQIFDFAA